MDLHLEVPQTLDFVLDFWWACTDHNSSNSISHCISLLHLVSPALQYTAGLRNALFFLHDGEDAVIARIRSFLVGNRIILEVHGGAHRGLHFGG